MSKEVDFTENSNMFLGLLTRKLNDEKKKLRRNIRENEGRWTRDEHNQFISEILRIGIKNWKKV
jgi:hypothetical protein